MKRPTAHKYSAKATPCGFCPKPHPSRREARRCADLHILQRAGEIDALVVGPRFFFEVNGQPLLHDNGRRAVYTPDWRYRRVRDNRQVVEDTKGMRVRDWPLRKALFRACYPDIEVIES